MNRLGLALASLLLEIITILVAAWFVGLAVLAAVAQDDGAYRLFMGRVR